MSQGKSVQLKAALEDIREKMHDLATFRKTKIEVEKVHNNMHQFSEAIKDKPHR